MITTYVDSCKIAACGDEIVRRAIAESIVGVTNVVKTEADSQDDINGTDWIVYIGKKTMRIDVKVRSKDYGKDDFVLEVYSNTTTKSPGWTRDSHKNTDLVLWVWLDTGRYHFMPFTALMRAFDNVYEYWLLIFKPIYHTTADPRWGKKENYQSLSIVVPRQCIIDEIRQIMVKC